MPDDTAAALALLRALNRSLLGSDSATLVLERWCRARRLAGSARILAERLDGAERAPEPAQRRRLRVGSAGSVRHRQVRLRYGPLVLSEAENWYVPSRLTGAMNRALERSDVSFGRAVRALGFRRHTVSAELLWRPDLAPDVAAASKPPRHVLRHRAVLVRPDGLPFSEVLETYTAAVLEHDRLGTSR